MIERLIASGRDLGDFKYKKGKGWWQEENYTALEIATKFCKPGVVDLLKRFLTNPAQTRHEVRVKLGMLTELSAEVLP